MQKREKLLAIALGSVVLIWFGLPMFEAAFIAPLAELEADEERLRDEANKKFDKQIELRKMEKQLAAWRKISLPPDPLDAQRVYQEWITDLAQLSGFDGIKITLERRNTIGGVYTTIPVTLEAKATNQELAQFLDRFATVDLLHRISTCDVISPASEGNPDLQVSITAEGLSVRDATERTRIFPQFTLSSVLKKEQTTFEVPESVSGFPLEGEFRIRIEDEFVNVVQVAGQKWTLQRGVARTFAEDHPAGASIEWFPLAEESRSHPKSVEDMWTYSVFTKPAPQATYDPKLAETTPPPAIRGRNWEWKLNVNSWNPAFGSPRFTLLEGPEGVKIDERTGSVSWKVTPEAELGQQTLQLMVWGSASKEAGFTSNLNLRVRDPNEPPELNLVGPLRFFLGRASNKKIAADDPDGENDRLRYSIANAPEGMRINDRDGTITWSPPETLDVQSLEIRVTVTDSDEDPESVSRTIPVTVEEDSARYTYLTTTFKREFENGDSEWEAYLFDRATNKTTMLKVGEQLTITDLELNVKEIGDDFVKVERPDGNFKIVFERPLVDMVKSTETAAVVPVSESTQPEPEKPVEPTPGTEPTPPENPIPETPEPEAGEEKPAESAPANGNS